MSEEFSHDISGAAEVLGIELDRDLQYSWIVQRALEHQLDPEEWKEIVHDTDQYAYFNMKSGVCVSHSCFSTYREFSANIL